MVSSRKSRFLTTGSGVMQLGFWLRNSILLICAASPAALYAQFQEPTAEELKMTADPKAPGAAAVYLYREDVTDDNTHIRSYYERIKVLTEKGMELATVQIPYMQGIDSVTDIEGRTIHADGTVIPLTAKPTDLMDVKSKDYQRNTVTFTLPNVEVGSILEYRLKIGLPFFRISEPTWSIQQDYFVRKSHFSFHPDHSSGGYVTDNHGQILDRIMCNARVGSGEKVDYEKGKDLYNLDITDTPAAPNEDWMPPINDIKWSVEFYYTNARSDDEFWSKAGKLWAQESNDFANPSRGLKKAVADIVAPTDTEEQKAQKIYAAVQKLDNTSFSRQKSKVERKKEKLKDIHNAEDVWKQQSGYDDEIALLYVALARAADLKAWPMQVVNRNRAIFDAGYLSTKQLDDYIAVVVIDGKDVYLDPGQKMCPYGRLHWKHTIAYGLRASEKGAVVAMTPAGTYKTAVNQRIADLTIDEQGSVKGSARIVMTGPDALYWRQLALKNDPEEVKKQFNEYIRAYLPDGVQADFDHFISLDDYNVNLMAIVNVSGSLATATGRHFFLPGLFFESQAKHPFVAQDKRTILVDLHYALMEQDDVTYHLPSGFNVESVPKTADVSWPGFAALKINSGVGSGSVEVFRTFARSFALLEPKAYNDLHDFYLKVATADQQQIVLTRATAGKGN
jgi:hypothetical protein